MGKIRVLIVDDSAYSRQTIKRILEKDSGIEVIDISSDGVDAMAKTLRLNPDIITLDLEMPEMGGFSFLRWLMKKNPIPVIVVSSFSDSKTVFKALELGAADFIAKPTRITMQESRNLEKDLLSKVKGVKDLRMDRLSKNLELFEEQQIQQAPPEISEQEVKVVAIGSSTGGPTALQIILTQLPADFPAALAISQHMPKGFTLPFAQRMNGISQIEIKEAQNGDLLENGKALICPGGYHLSFKKRGKRVHASLKEPKTSDKYIPSVSTMMSALADIYDSAVMGVVLTGMGSDGKDGMLEIKGKGGYTIVESEDTAVVFGMPAEVIKVGAAGRVLPISEIPSEIIKLVKKTELS